MKHMLLYVLVQQLLSLINDHTAFPVTS